MIEPDYLSELRRTYLPCSLLLMVQLEQRCPNWWPTLAALAEELGMQRKQLNCRMIALEKAGLIARYSVHGQGSGTWVWWVKRSAKDKKPLTPAWRLRNIHTQSISRVELGKVQQWSTMRGLSHETVRSFLNGRIHVLNDQWRLLSTPMDEITPEELDVVA